MSRVIMNVDPSMASQSSPSPTTSLKCVLLCSVVPQVNGTSCRDPKDTAK